MLTSNYLHIDTHTHTSNRTRWLKWTRTRINIFLFSIICCLDDLLEYIIIYPEFMNQLERLHIGAFYNLHKQTVSYYLSLKKRDRQAGYECVYNRKTKKNEWFSNSLLLESPYTLKIYYWETQRFFFIYVDVSVIIYHIRN